MSKAPLKYKRPSANSSSGVRQALALKHHTKPNLTPFYTQPGTWYDVAIEGVPETLLTEASMSLNRRVLLVPLRGCSKSRFFCKRWRYGKEAISPSPERGAMAVRSTLFLLV